MVIAASDEELRTINDLLDAAIIGMGYVGLPLAREATAAGLAAVGLDINPDVVGRTEFRPLTY